MNIVLSIEQSHILRIDEKKKMKKNKDDHVVIWRTRTSEDRLLVRFFFAAWPTFRFVVKREEEAERERDDVVKDTRSIIERYRYRLYVWIYTRWFRCWRWYHNDFIVTKGIRIFACSSRRD